MRILLGFNEEEEEGNRQGIKKTKRGRDAFGGYHSRWRWSIHIISAASGILAL